MKFATSYFYQIRHFKPYMIPISTCYSDPLWFHDFTGIYEHVWVDKRGIYNGIRCENLHFQETEDEVCNCGKGCLEALKPEGTCSFLTIYRKQLDRINFTDFMEGCKRIAAHIQSTSGFIEEPIIVLIVYEAPTNKCSERKSLQDWLQSHGQVCEELKYPILKNYI